MKNFIPLIILLFFLNRANGQTDTPKCNKGRIDFGGEVQVYPAGLIPTLTANIFFANQLAIRIRIGGNFANRRDWSHYNDYETAKGFGASLGLVTYYPYKKGYFTVCAIIDIWKMTTKWKDDLDTPLPLNGETKTIVIQPWIDIGYLFKINNTRINIGPTLGFGREINVITRGDRVGEGWMNSITLTMNYPLKP